MANFLSKLFGTKSDRDLKEVKPFLDATLKAYPEIQKLDNDQLRSSTTSSPKPSAWSRKPPAASPRTPKSS